MVTHDSAYSFWSQRTRVGTHVIDIVILPCEGLPHLIQPLLWPSLVQGAEGPEMNRELFVFPVFRNSIEKVETVFHSLGSR